MVPMYVDDKTVRELEILQSRDGGPSVLELLDYTSTPGGREVLRARFATPFADGSSIRRVQHAVRFLADHGPHLPVDRSALQRVLHYLGSRWAVGTRSQTAPVGVLESLWVAVRYPDLLDDIGHGTRAVEQLTGDLQNLVAGMQRLDPPGALAELLARISALLDQCGTIKVSSRGRPWRLMALDRLLRRTKRSTLTALLQAVYELDALCSMAQATTVHRFVFPEIVETSDLLLHGDGIFHPFTTNPVRNPVTLAGGQALIFLTGPNMAGKTTYLRAVGLAVYLAHLGMGVPATRLRLCPLESLLTSLSPEDNLRAGLSYYMAEVRRVRQILEGLATRRPALVIVDEVFKGTNVRDAVEASRLVILGFCRVGSAGFLVSSHLTELADDLRDEPSIRFACLDGTIRDGQARYGYAIREGVSTRRFGLHLLEQEGVPALLTSLAS